jgi:hypothetical protein
MTRRKGKTGLIDVKELLERDEDFLRAALQALAQAALEAEMTETIMLGLILTYVLAFQLPLLPIFGGYSAGAVPTLTWHFVWDVAPPRGSGRKRGWPIAAATTPLADHPGRNPRPAGATGSRRALFERAVSALPGSEKALVGTLAEM